MNNSPSWRLTKIYWQRVTSRKMSQGLLQTLPQRNLASRPVAWWLEELATVRQGLSAMGSYDAVACRLLLEPLALFLFTATHLKLILRDGFTHSATRSATSGT